MLQHRLLLIATRRRYVSIPNRDYLMLQLANTTSSTSPSVVLVSIPNRDYLMLQQRHPGILDICSFQGSVARMF
jgi:hypothetical protein